MTISDKSSITTSLHQAYADLFEWLESRTQEEFNKVYIEGKWTTAQHCHHLLKSTRPINKTLRMPRMAIRTMFGTNNREERTYEQLVEKYLTALNSKTIVPPPQFAPKETHNRYTKEDLIQQLAEERDQLIAITEKWKEENLSKLILPHPAIGKLTIREMLFFTIYHTGHHLRILKEKNQ